MKRLLAVTLLLGLPIYTARAQTNESTSPTQQAFAELKAQHRYDPAASTTQASDRIEVPPIDRSFILDPYTVVEGHRLRALKQAFADEARLRRKDEFSFFDGGPLWKADVRKVRVALGGWDGGNALQLLRISW